MMEINSVMLTRVARGFPLGVSKRIDEPFLPRVFVGRFLQRTPT